MENLTQIVHVQYSTIQDVYFVLFLQEEKYNNSKASIAAVQDNVHSVLSIIPNKELISSVPEISATPLYVQMILELLVPRLQVLDLVIPRQTDIKKQRERHTDRQTYIFIYLFIYLCMYVYAD